MLKKLVWNRQTVRGFFSSKRPTKPAKESPPELKTAKPPTPVAVRNDAVPAVPEVKYTAGCQNLLEFLSQKGRIEDVAVMEYKRAPAHPSHFDRSSPDFIESEYDDHHLASQIHDYNEIIDNLKRDLLIHRRYQEEMQRIEGQSLEHLQRGVTRNVFDEVKDYSGVPKEHLKPDRNEAEVLFYLLDNLGMTINNTPFHEKWSATSNEVERNRLLDERPVNPHFHALKGSKFDVEVPHHLRHKHVADRLGHPEIFPNPLETILRLEQYVCHPGYLDQPFIQIPSAEPDSSLDLRPGEVLYENPHSREWHNFALCTLLSSSLYFFAWMPYLLFIKSTTPSSKVREEVLMPYIDQNFFTFDTGQLGSAIYLTTIFFFLRITTVPSSVPAEQRHEDLRVQHPLQRLEGPAVRPDLQRDGPSGCLIRKRPFTKSPTSRSCPPSPRACSSTSTSRRTASPRSLTSTTAPP